MWISTFWSAFSRESVYFWYYFSLQFRQIFIYYLFGILIGSTISVFFKERLNSSLRGLRESHGILSLSVAAVLGILSPLCLYGTIPLAASLSKSGMKDDLLASFMMASILLNPQLIIYSLALGLPLVIIRVLSAFFCAVLAGLLLRKYYNGTSFFDFSGFDEPKSRDTDPNRLKRYLKNVGRNIKATGPMFLLGIALSALFQRYVPESVITGLFGGNKAWGVLMAATLGVPLYACGGGTIPLIRAWLIDGMSLGSASAFMITGPATKITNLGALKIVLGLKRFLLYLVYVSCFSLVTGTIVNVFI